MGGEDRVTDRANVVGWADEASSDEFKMITVKGASHHFFVEQPALVQHPTNPPTKPTTKPMAHAATPATFATLAARRPFINLHQPRVS